MANKNVLDDIQWSYEEEKIERLPDHLFSIGVGQDLMKQAGVTMESMAASIDDAFINQLIDGGMNSGLCNGVQAYFRRRGKAIDIGTRKDFDDLGWADGCDLLDEQESNNS